MQHSYLDPSVWREDLAQCRALLRGGSRTFHAASLVLPQNIREPATALYAFCRLADDAVDEGRDPLAALQQLRARLDNIYSGEEQANPVDRAFANVVMRFAIPQALPQALIEGFEWDAAGRRYRTLSELHEYGARVAGAVGAMMALIMGARSSNVVARACDMGVAMQLTNIARDVGEDARAGRIYLPLDWLQEAGIDPDAWLEQPRFDAALGSVIARVLESADELYERSAQGIAWLPATCRPGMHAARLLYAEIGREVERCSLDSVAARARVAAWRKSLLLVRAAIIAARPKASLTGPALKEVRFLLDAVDPGAPRAETVNRALWMLDLFERLERRQLSEHAH